MLPTRHRLLSSSQAEPESERLEKASQNRNRGTSTPLLRSGITLNTKTVKTQQRKENHRPVSLRSTHVKSSVKSLQTEYRQTTQRPSTKIKLTLSQRCKNGSTYVSIHIINHINGLQRQKSHDHTKRCRKGLWQNPTGLHAKECSTGGEIPQCNQGFLRQNRSQHHPRQRTLKAIPSSSWLRQAMHFPDSFQYRAKALTGKTSKASN